MNKYTAIRRVRDLTGFGLAEAREQVETLRTLAEARALLPGDIFLICPKGNIPLADVYDAVGVEEDD